ncbi:HEPN/Toprim-associated domain-containing protein [Dactylosporangium sp. NPDC000555]|uniref:HEPN/Toprim-associated domain-containing protein n=1 Tax=Dactylosporangium sp. NPDC000555 TaxID=3154260 RepID=UPI003326B01A
MSTYKSIFVDGKEVFSFRNEFHPETVYYFTLADLQRLRGREALPYTVGAYGGDPYEDDLSELELPVFMASARDVRERLEVLGYGEPLVRRLYELILSEGSSGLYTQKENGSDDQDGLGDPLTLEDWPYDDWKCDVSDHVKRKRQLDGPVNAVGLRDLGPLSVLQEMDERIVMRAILESVEDTAQVAVDAGELEECDWLTVYDDDKDEDFGSEDINKGRGVGPPIVITEGSFDAFVLSNAIALIRPHLVSYIKFLDYDTGAEGGASAAIRALKAFAAAGVANRIVAIFDNDSAAYEAVMGLRDTRLPSHYRVIHYPDLDLAAEYPTLGPQGQATMNVNRLAGSIELYLGTDVLCDADGLQRPVQWKGYMGKVKSYQGEVVDKSAVQRAFREKLQAAQANSNLIETQDWSGIELILDHLVSQLGSF